MDSEIFKKWFFEKFVPKCRLGLKELDLPQKAILVLDNAPSHPDIATLTSDDGQITCLFLPPNTTSLIQPMDQGVLQSIKLTYKRDLLLRMLDGGDEINIAEFAKKMNIKDAVLLSAKCWNDIKPDSTTKSWKNILSTNPNQMASAENNELASSASEMEGHLDNFDLTPTEKETWLTADAGDSCYRELTEDEIISCVNEVDVAVEDNDVEDDEPPPTVTHAQACAALETVLKYLEQQPDIPMNTTIVVNSLLITTARKRNASLKQTKLTDYFK